VTRYESRPNQETIILNLLRTGKARSPEGWVQLPEILNLRISQYSARIWGLRRKGYVIENEGEWRHGKLCTRFRLLSEPRESIATPPASTTALAAKKASVGENLALFPEAELERTSRWEDNG
jgi:hypothetical protein